MSSNRSLLFNREKDIHSGNQKKQSVLTLGCLREKRKAKKTMVDSSKKKKEEEKEERTFVEEKGNNPAIYKSSSCLQFKSSPPKA
jgi:hypothetical protein